MGTPGDASAAGDAPAAAALASRIAAIATDPQFDSALALYADRLTALYREHPVAIGLFGDLGRFAIVAAFAAGPASIRQVAGTLLGPGLASRHRVAAHVAALRRSGAITPVGKGAGARWQLAPWVLTLLHRWLDAVASPALAWRPPPWPDLDDPAVLHAYLQQLLAASRGGRSAFAALPRVGRLMQLTAGHALLMEIVRASGGRAGVAFTLPRGQRAADWGVSRGHVGDLVRGLCAEGSLDMPDRRHLRLTAPFCAEARGWAACNFALANATLDGKLLAILPR